MNRGFVSRCIVVSSSEANNADLRLGASSQAEKWKLAYEGISDLASIGGAFASIFYTPVDKVELVENELASKENMEKHPFIVLVIKGEPLPSHSF